MSTRERPTIRERMTTEGLTAEAALQELQQECDRLRAKVEVALGERNEVRAQLNAERQEVARIAGQLNGLDQEYLKILRRCRHTEQDLKTERQGALAREQAIEEAVTLLRRVSHFLPRLSNLRSGSADEAAGELIEVTYAVRRFLLAWPEEALEEAAPLPPSCCRTGCCRSVEWQSRDGTHWYCAEHWHEAIHWGEP